MAMGTFAGGRVGATDPMKGSLLVGGMFKGQT